MRTYCHARLLVALAFACAAAGYGSRVAEAQALNGSILGRVVDGQGAAVPGARVTIRNTDVASSRSLAAGSDGTFRAVGLVAGAYTVEATAGALASKRPLRLTVTLGSSTQVVLRLEIATVKQGTTVKARSGSVEGNTIAPPANTAEASVGTFLAGLTVTYLPNRDRDFSQFAGQAAATTDDPDGTGISIAGQRSTALAVQVDGTSFIDPLLGQRRGAGDGGLFLPLSAVREFEVLHSGVEAGTGDTGAGLLSVATKSGANRARGDAFYTGRPSQFTSSDAFGNPVPGFQNTFGFGYGSPIRKNKSFYFVSVEQDFVHAPFFIQFAPQAPGVALPAALAAQQGQVVESQSPTAVFLRLDDTLSQRSTANLEFGYNRVQTTNAQPEAMASSRSLDVLGHAGTLSGQSITSRLGLSTVLDARTFNSAVLAFALDHRGRTPNSFAPEQYINGFGALGGDSEGRHLYTSRQLQLADDLTLTRGTRALTLGGRYAYDPAYEQQEHNLNGRFDYNSLADYVNNAPRRFQQTFGTGNTRYRGAISQLAFYANVRAEIHSKLFLTAGLRWAGQFNPQPPAAGVAPVVTERIPNDLSQWQPRLGLAWNPGPGTTMRASAGLFAAPTPGTFFHRVFADNGAQTVTADSYFDPSLLLLTAANTAAPHALGGPPAGLLQPHAVASGIAAGFRNPRSLEAAISADQRISAKLEITTGYIFASAWRLERQLDENLAPPTGVSPAGTPLFTAPRPLAGVGRLLVEQSTAHSTYHGGYVSLNSPFSRRTTLLVNYTLSRTLDDDSSSGPYSPVSAVNPFSLRQERGYSALDQRQSLNVNAIVNLPVGFKLNPFFQAHSGTPFNAIAGQDLEGTADDRNARAILNGVVVPRNYGRQPYFADLDLRLVKDFTLKGEGHHLDLFMDVFNLPNAQNRRFDPESLSLYGTPASPLYSAGTPLFAPGTTALGGPREIQFTVRLVGF